jgi:hypothetical protein
MFSCGTPLTYWRQVENFSLFFVILNTLDESFAMMYYVPIVHLKTNNNEGKNERKKNSKYLEDQHEVS